MRLQSRREKRVELIRMSKEFAALARIFAANENLEKAALATSLSLNCELLRWWVV